MANRRRIPRLTLLTISLVMLLVSAPGAETRAPDFKLLNLAGEEVRLAEVLTGGPVIVDFWATWCKPCVKAFPELQDVLDRYSACGLRVLAVSIDGPRSTSRVKSLIASKGNTFDVLLDPAQDVARKFHVTSVPRTVLIDSNGVITYAVTGYRPTNHEQLVAAVSKLFPEGCRREPDAGEEASE